MYKPNTWTKIETCGEIPEPIYRHSACIYKNSLYIFGGSNEISSSNKLYRIDLDSVRPQWHLEQCRGLLPSPRQDCSAVVYEDCMYIYAGYNGNVGAYRHPNDMFRYRFADRTWEHVWPKKDTKGVKPSPRYLHTAVVYKDRMYVFGGYETDSYAIWKNDLYEFDFKNRCFMPVNDSGDKPTPRFNHSAVVIDDCMYVFGGWTDAEANDLYKYEFSSKKWKRIYYTGKTPPKVWGHATVVFSGMMYVFGGFEHQNLNDLYEYNPKNQSWKLIECNETKPPARWSGKAVGSGSLMFLFGGIGRKMYNDLYCFKFEDPVLPVMKILQKGTLLDTFLNCKS